MRALCWFGYCDAELDWIDGEWVCPEGHELRQYEDLNLWVRQHVEVMQHTHGQHRRYFGDPP